METNKFGYATVTFASNNNEPYAWDDFYIYYHPEERRWFWDEQSGCSCTMFEFEEDRLQEFFIHDLHKIIRDNVYFPQYKDSVRREVKAFIKEHNL